MGYQVSFYNEVTFCTTLPIIYFWNEINIFTAGGPVTQSSIKYSRKSVNIPYFQPHYNSNTLPFYGLLYEKKIVCTNKQTKSLACLVATRKTFNKPRRNCSIVLALSDFSLKQCNKTYMLQAILTKYVCKFLVFTKLIKYDISFLFKKTTVLMKH